MELQLLVEVEVESQQLVVPVVLEVLTALEVLVDWSSWLL